VLYQASGDADIAGSELTPEDRALVMMAVRWLKGQDNDEKNIPPLKLVQTPVTK
jgi:hypothetical protein